MHKFAYLFKYVWNLNWIQWLASFELILKVLGNYIVVSCIVICNVYQVMNVCQYIK